MTIQRFIFAFFATVLFFLFAMAYKKIGKINESLVDVYIGFIIAMVLAMLFMP